MIKFLKNLYHKYHIYEFRKSPFLWIYAAYLSIRYIDDYNVFPAIKLNSFIKIKIQKKVDSKFVIKRRLIFEPFLNSEKSTSIIIQKGAKIIVENDFVLGDDIRIIVEENAFLKLGGKNKESASGITANAKIMVSKYVEIGEDCIIAWDTFVTDSDWHTFGTKQHTIPTVIGKHVWLGVGVKVLKGVNIGKNSIVTTNSTVVQGAYPDQTMLGGNPAKILKTNIEDWVR